MIQRVAAAFAQFLHDRAEVALTEPGSVDAARRFWAGLTTIGDVVETVGVVTAIEALASNAPHHVHPVTD
jgi:hypothetical protein